MWFICLTVLLFLFQTDTLTHYSTYTEMELIPLMNKLASLVIKAAENSKICVCIKHSYLIVLNSFNATSL